MYAKRAMALRMMAQVGPPHFFLTLTAHESQPQLLMACAFAHLRSLAGWRDAPLKDASEEAARAVNILMNQTDEWTPVNRSKT